LQRRATLRWAFQPASGQFEPYGDHGGRRVRGKPGSAAPVTQKLERGTTVTAVKTEQGWTLVARRGKLLGHVASDKIDSIEQGMTAGRVAGVENLGRCFTSQCRLLQRKDAFR
jgi:hypothetical protein